MPYPCPTVAPRPARVLKAKPEAFPRIDVRNTIQTSGSFLHRKLVTTYCPVGTERLNRLMKVVANGKVDLRPLLTHSMKISETPAAYDLFRKREGGVLKIALRP